MLFDKLSMTYPDRSRWEPRSVCQAFIEANRSQKFPEEWYILKNGLEVGRFFGDLGGAGEFKRLGESLHLAYCAVVQQNIDYHGPSGFLECLWTMHEKAFRDPTPLLRLKFRYWGLEPPLPDGEVLQDLWNEMSPSIGDHPPYPVHPHVDYLVHDVFTSAIAFVDAILGLKTALPLASEEEFLRPSHSRSWPGIPPFIATQDGEEGVESREELRSTASGTEDGAVTMDLPEKREPARAPSEYVFHFDEETERWRLRFPGDKPPDSFYDYQGLHMYQRLLKWKGMPMNGRVLYWVDDKKIGNLPKREHVFTFQDKRNFCRTLEEIDGKIAAATEAGRQDTIDDLESQRQRLYEQLGRDLDVHGNPKQLGSSDPEYLARRAAQRVMDYALKKIRRLMPNLAEYLAANCNLRRQEYEWCYRPTEEIEWEF